MPTSQEFAAQMAAFQAAQNALRDQIVQHAGVSASYGSNTGGSGISGNLGMPGGTGIGGSPGGYKAGDKMPDGSIVIAAQDGVPIITSHGMAIGMYGSNGQGAIMYDPTKPLGTSGPTLSAPGGTNTGPQQYGGIPGMGTAAPGSGAANNAAGGTAGMDPLQIFAMLQGMQDQTNAANEARYQEGLGVNTQAKTDEMAQAQQSLASMMGLVGTGTAAQHTREGQNRARQEGQTEQDLLNRGLGSTTVRSTMLRGVDDQSALRDSEIDSQADQQKLGIQGNYMDSVLKIIGDNANQRMNWMGNKTENGPDMNLLAQLLSQPRGSATQPGGSGMPGVPQAPTGAPGATGYAPGGNPNLGGGYGFNVGQGGWSQPSGAGGAANPYAPNNAVGQYGGQQFGTLLPTSGANNFQSSDNATQRFGEWLNQYTQATGTSLGNEMLPAMVGNLAIGSGGQVTSTVGRPTPVATQKGPVPSSQTIAARNGGYIDPRTGLVVGMPQGNPNSNPAPNNGFYLKQQPRR